MSSEDIKTIVREKYGQAAIRAQSASESACCCASERSDCGIDPITSNLYDVSEVGEVA